MQGGRFIGEVLAGKILNLLADGRQLGADLIQQFLIRQRLDVVKLDSDRDFRQGRAGGEQVWFAPLDALATRAMDAAWDDLTDCAAPVPLRLGVNGRTVELPQSCGRVARASFDDLCGRPLGPADYLAVAEAVDVLMIDGVPRLGPQNFDRAKRFVTLVDALYEAKVRLIASAADQPQSATCSSRPVVEAAITAGARTSTTESEASALNRER